MSKAKQRLKHKHTNLSHEITVLTSVETFLNLQELVAHDKKLIEATGFSGLQHRPLRSKNIRWDGFHFKWLYQPFQVDIITLHDSPSLKKKENSRQRSPSVVISVCNVRVWMDDPSVHLLLLNTRVSSYICTQLTVSLSVRKGNRLAFVKLFLAGLQRGG